MVCYYLHAVQDVHHHDEEVDRKPWEEECGSSEDQSDVSLPPSHHLPWNTHADLTFFESTGRCTECPWDHWVCWDNYYYRHDILAEKCNPHIVEVIVSIWPCLEDQSDSLSIIILSDVISKHKNTLWTMIHRYDRLPEKIHSKFLPDSILLLHHRQRWLWWRWRREKREQRMRGEQSRREDKPDDETFKLNKEMFLTMGLEIWETLGKTIMRSLSMAINMTEIEEKKTKVDCEKPIILQTIS